MARWIQFEELQRSQESRAFSGNPSIDLDTEEAEAVPTRSTALKSALFTIHFRKVARKNEAGVFDLYCNYCPKQYKFRTGGGYGTYWSHITNNHQVELGRAQAQSQLNFQPVSSQNIESQGEGTPYSSQLFRFDILVAREQMCYFICEESLALQFADSMNFECRMKAAYNPGAQRIPRMTMTRTLEKLHIRYKSKLKSVISKIPYRVAICSDIWSDKFIRRHYIAVTLHWIDYSWNLNKRLIAFRRFNCQHSATNIAKAIIKICNHFKMLDKIFSIGFDNASANTASIRELIQACNPTLHGKYFHTRCIAHILNLCVQDGLRILNNSIQPIRDAVDYIHGRVRVRRRWEKFCREAGVHPKIFNLDVPNRWNSTYEMLSATFEYRELLCSFFAMNIESFILLSSYWDDCIELMELLQVFQYATKDLSGVYYPTVCKFMYHCCLIAEKSILVVINPICKI